MSKYNWKISGSALLDYDPRAIVKFEGTETQLSHFSTAYAEVRVYPSGVIKFYSDAYLEIGTIVKLGELAKERAEKLWEALK